MVRWLRRRFTTCPWIISHLILCFLWMLNAPTMPVAQAQTVVPLPQPGTLIPASPAVQSPIIRGITIYPDQPFQFDFIIDRGDQPIRPEQFSEDTEKLVRYFLAALTVPENELWVNLSPYEEDRIIADGFGRTDMGRDLLAQDYLLKQLTASMLHPDHPAGQQFWKRVYAKAQDLLGTTDIPIDTFNKVWIVPETAAVYENGTTAVVIESQLKVLLEEDYLALAHQKAGNVSVSQNIDPQIRSINAQLVRDVILPEIEREINTGENFAALRQIYHAVILSNWYKSALKNGLLSREYVGKNKVGGVISTGELDKDRIYDQYLAAFQKGVYNFIREDIDPVSRKTLPRKYFSGGVTLQGETTVTRGPSDRAMSILSKRDLFRVRVNGIDPETQDAFEPVSLRRAAISTLQTLRPFTFLSRLWMNWRLNSLERQAMRFLNVSGNWATALVPAKWSAAALTAAHFSLASVSSADVLFQSPQDDPKETEKIESVFDRDLERFQSYVLGIENQIGQYELPDLSRSAPLLDVTSTDLLTQFQLRRRIPTDSGNWVFDPRIRAYLLGDDSLGYKALTNSRLEPSPGAALDLNLDYDNWFTWHGGFGVSYTQLNSSGIPINNLHRPLHRLYELNQDVSMDWVTLSLDTGFGKTFLLGDHVGFTPYLGGNAWLISHDLEISEYIVRGFAQFGGGANLVYLDNNNRLRLYGDISYEYDTIDVAANLVDNGVGSYIFNPHFGHFTLGADYTRFIPGTTPFNSQAVIFGLSATETIQERTYAAFTEWQVGEFRLKFNAEYDQALTDSYVAHALGLKVENNAEERVSTDQLRLTAGIFYRPSPAFEIGLEGFRNSWKLEAAPPYIEGKRDVTGGARILLNWRFSELFGYWKGARVGLSRTTPHKGLPIVNTRHTSVSSGAIDIRFVIEGIELYEEGEELFFGIPGVQFVFDNARDFQTVGQDLEDGKLSEQNEALARTLWTGLKNQNWSQFDPDDLLRLREIFFTLSNRQFLVQTFAGMDEVIRLAQESKFSSDSFDDFLDLLKTSAEEAINNSTYPLVFWEGLYSDLKLADYRGIGRDVLLTLKSERSDLFGQERLEIYQDAFQTIFRDDRTVPLFLFFTQNIVTTAANNGDVAFVVQTWGDLLERSGMIQRLEAAGIGRDDIEDSIQAVAGLDYRQILRQNNFPVDRVETLVEDLSDNGLNALLDAFEEFDLNGILLGTNGTPIGELIAVFQHLSEHGPSEVKDLSDTIYQLIDIYENTQTLRKFLDTVQIGFTEEESRALIQAVTVLTTDNGFVDMRNRFLASTEAKIRNREYLLENHPEEAASLELFRLRMVQQNLIRELQRIEAQRQAAPDRNMSSEKDLGGIDLDPAHFKIHIEKGSPASIDFAPLPPIESFHIDGILPVIINITPVTNIPALLGLSEDRGDIPLLSQK